MHGLLVAALEDARDMSAADVSDAYHRLPSYSRNTRALPASARQHYLKAALRLSYVILAREILLKQSVPLFPNGLSPAHPHVWELVFSSMGHLVKFVTSWCVDEDTDEQFDCITVSSKHGPMSCTCVPVLHMDDCDVSLHERMMTTVATSASRYQAAISVEFQRVLNSTPCQDADVKLNDDEDVKGQKNMLYMAVIIEREGYMLASKAPLGMKTYRAMLQSLLKQCFADQIAAAGHKVSDTSGIDDADVTVMINRSHKDIGNAKPDAAGLLCDGSDAWEDVPGMNCSVIQVV